MCPISISIAARVPEVPVVFVLDSDASMRESLKTVICRAGWRTETLASAEEFLRLPHSCAPHCIVTEADLPGLSGLELQRLLLDRRETPFIFVSGSIDIQSSVSAMKAGALEFLSKPFDCHALLRSLHEAIERSREEFCRGALLQTLQARYDSLTQREREVLKLVTSGYLNKQVSAELGIAEITVKIHRGNMMRKMRARSIVELVTMASTLADSVPLMSTYRTRHRQMQFLLPALAG